MTPTRPHEAVMQARRLFIAELLVKLDAMDEGRRTVDAIAYRTHAKLLRRAAAAYPYERLRREFGRATGHAARQMLANRLFMETGRLGRDPAAREAQITAERLFAELGVEGTLNAER
jgi:hypothetical protein